MNGYVEEEKINTSNAEDRLKLTIKPLKFSNKVSNETFDKLKSFKYIKGDIDSIVVLSGMLQINLAELGFTSVETIQSQMLKESGRCISETFIFVLNPKESKMRRFAIQVNWMFGLHEDFGHIFVQLIEHGCRFNGADGKLHWNDENVSESEWDHRGAWWSPQIRVVRVNSFESIWARVVKAINKQTDVAIKREKYEIQRLKADNELTGCRSWFGSMHAMFPFDS